MEWISINDRLPELRDGISSEKVIVALGKQVVFGWYRINEWVTPDMIPFVKQEKITHWMPLPKSPN